MSTKSVLFIDSRVSNYQSFIDGLTEPTEVFVLDGASDGLAQMASYLYWRTGIDAIHVISHGSVGALYLGSTVLDGGNLSNYQSQLASIGSALTETGDILLYGCNVAQGNVGVQFLGNLAQATGADVAGSSDATGAEDLGGDWVLEEVAGSIEATTELGNDLGGLMASNTAPTFVVSDGKLTTNFGSTREGAVDVSIQSDGKVVVLGYSYSNTGSGAAVIARYNIDGTLDGSFDADGKLTIDGISAGAIEVQFGDKILVIGASNSGGHYFLSQFNSDGSPDTRFDALPKGSPNVLIAHLLAIQADGRILTAVVSLNGNQTNFLTYRYNIDGSLDTSFGHAGEANSTFGSANSSAKSIAVQTDGKIILAGSETDPETGVSNFAIARVNSNGTLDSSFHGDGKVTVALSPYWCEASSVAIQTDGKILIAGTSSNFQRGSGGGEVFALVRLNSDGSLDTTFDADGIATTSISNSNGSGANDLAIQGDGKILVAGWAFNGTNSNAFAIARYNIDGSLDTTFDGDGKVITSLGTIGSFAASLKVQTDGKILVVGYHYGNSTSVQSFDVLRYNTDGSLDDTFSPAENTLSFSPGYTEQGSPVAISPEVQIRDAELASSGNYNGAALTLFRHGGASIQDIFSSSGRTLTNLTANSYFAVDGVTIGRVTANDAGMLTLAFNANATPALVNRAMQQIAYSNTSHAPPATVQIDWTFNDGNTGAQGIGSAMSVTGSSMVQITAVNDPPVLTVPLVDQRSRVGSNFAFTISDGSFVDPDIEVLSYSVGMADGTAVPPWLVFNASTRTFTGTPSSFDIGAIDIQVTAKDAAGATASDVFRLTVNPANSLPTGGIAITGSIAQGQTLTASSTLADSDGLGTFSYQWKAAGTNIVGATANTFALTEVQVGKAISVTASYTDGHGTVETVTSNASAAVANVNDVPTGTVTITGTLAQAQTLTASNNLLDPDGLGTVAYQWKANGEHISGGTGNVFMLTEAQVGKAITVVASYVDGHGTAESVPSAISATVANVNDLPTGTVAIAGKAIQGQTLTATNTLADLDGLGTITYQWKANGSAITGATSISLPLAEAQVGKSITVSASYTDGHGTVESATSSATNAVTNVNDAPTGTVTITGNTSLGQVLTATNTLADLDGLGTIIYQWSADTTAISGATRSTLTLADAQIGKAITVTASYTDGHGTAESVISSATSLVTNVPPQTITGTAGNDPDLTGGQGNDTINGLAGLDTAIYTARMAAYTTAPTSISGPEGSDTLTSIERLQFLDANLAFDLDGNAGQVYRLYQAAFNRTPDLSGLGGWIAAMDGGMLLLTIASKFMESAEFQSLYGTDPTNAQFVANLYTNALHRPSQQDAGSAAGWVNQLSTNAVSKAQALVSFSESAENKASVLPVISGGITYATAAQATGPAKGQSFAGTPNTDSLIGTVGNDTFAGGAGNDTIEGGKGLDTAVYGGAKASHTVIRTATGLTVASGTDGTDTLTNVERLKFDDAILAMDTAGNAGQTYRLYQAAFNRTPDKPGLSDWVKGMDTGLTLTQMATAFIGSGEFKDKYGANPTNAQFVDLLYANALHRARTVGDDYWTHQLDSGVTREQALIGFSESAENQASLIGVIQNGIELLVG